MSGTGSIPEGKAKALRDSLARQSLTNHTDPLRFQELLNGVRRLALIPQWPNGIVQEIERLLKESARLKDEKQRKAFAQALTSLSHRFDIPDWATTITTAISENSTAARELLQAARWSRIQFSPNDLVSFSKAVKDKPDLLDDVILFARRGLIDLTGAAVQSNDRELLKRLLSSASQRSESPFEQTEQYIWSSLLQAALDLKDFQVFMCAFEHLHSRFDCLRLRDWGPLSKQIRNALFLLPQDAVNRVRRVFYYEEVDTSRCLKAFRESPLPNRMDGRGDWPFVGAGRVLMRWLINGYIAQSSDELKERLRVVIDGILVLPKMRQREAIFHLLARGQGVYAGALAEQPLQGIKDICLQMKSLGEDDLCRMFSKPDTIRDAICELITSPEFPAPPRLPPKLGSIVHIANLTLANQRDLFDGVFWEREEWFSQLSPLVDHLCNEYSSRSEWLVAFQWFIETLTSSVADLVSENIYAHQFKNEFDREWRSNMIEVSGKATEADSLRARFIDRVERFLVSRAWLHVGKRQGVRVDRVFGEQHLGWMKKTATNSRLSCPRPLVLWLVQGQRESTLVPLVNEVLSNAIKALEPLPPESRLYRFEVTIEDKYWAKLSVRNTYDPWSERASSTGFGREIIAGLCRGLRSRNSQARKPWHREDVSEPGFSSTDDLKVFEQVVYLPLAAPKMAEES